MLETNIKKTVNKIKKETKNIQDQLITWRRYFHLYPEVGLNTKETSKKIEEELIKIGLDVRAGVGGYGVIGLLKGDNPGKVIAIRADIDALPIKEETDLPFASTNENMHACGHDAHISMALGAAKILSQHRDEIYGTVKFIFQPGEEVAEGAKLMLNDGAFENPKVHAIISLHIGKVWEGFKPGQVGIGYGAILASMDRFDIKIKGLGGHGAYPHLSIDPINIACHLVTELQTIVSREIDPLTPVVVTVGEIHSGVAFNVIPDGCTLSGTVRTLDKQTREFIAMRIGEIAKNVTKGMRSKASYKYSYGTPPVINDEEFTEEFRKIAIEVVGEENVKEIPCPSMGGEDIAFYLEKVPGTFFFLPGCNSKKGQIYHHHHPKFDIDEDILWLGSTLFIVSAINWLEVHS